MHRRVFLPGALAEIFKNRGHVRPRQQPRQIIDDPGDPPIGGGPRDAPEYIAQKRRGLGERRRLAREGLRRALVEPARREQAVGDRLRLQVRELLFCEVRNQHLLIARQQFAQRRAAAVALAEDAGDVLAQQARPGGHSLCQLGRVVDRDAVGVEEVLPERRDIEMRAWHCAELLVVAARQNGVPAPFPFDVPAKLHVVGQDQIRQRVAVAQQLPALLHLVEVRADVLALDMADREPVPVHDEVGRAVFALRGLVDGLDARRPRRLDQPLQRRPVAVLRRLSAAPLVAQLAQVDPEVAIHGALPFARSAQAL